MLDFLRLRAIAGIEQVQGRRYTRSISLDGAQGTVAVEPGKGDALLATVRFPRLPSLPVIIAACGGNSTWTAIRPPSRRSCRMTRCWRR